MYFGAYQTQAAPARAPQNHVHPFSVLAFSTNHFTKYLGTLFHTTVTFSGPISKRTCPTTGGPQQTKYRSSASHPPNPMTSMCPGTIKTMLIERTYSLVNFDQGTSIIYFLTCHFSRLLSNVNTECLM